MPAPTIDLATSGTNPKTTTVDLLESTVNAALNTLYADTQTRLLPGDAVTPADLSSAIGSAATLTALGIAGYTGPDAYTEGLAAVADGQAFAIFEDLGLKVYTRSGATAVLIGYIRSAGAVEIIGGWDASAGTFPGGDAATQGQSWVVTVGGTVDGIAFAVDDTIIAIEDDASATVYAGQWLKSPTSRVTAVAGRTGAVVVTKTDVGLPLADNTADASKPVSTAQAAADAISSTRVFDAIRSVGDVYTVAAPAGIRAIGKTIIIVPDADSTTTLPKLNVGDGEFNIASASGFAHDIGRLKAGIPAILRFASGAWRLIELREMRVAPAITTGTAAAYAVTIPEVPIIAAYTLISLRFHIANSGPATISINGADPVNLLSEGFSQLATNQLTRLGQYLGYFNGSNVQLIGVESATRPALHTDRHISTARDLQRQITSFASPLVSGGGEHTAITLDGTTRTWWCASHGDVGRCIRVTGGTGTIDLRNIAAGSDVPVAIDVSFGATAKVLCNDGGAGDVKTIAGSAFVNVHKTANARYHFQAVLGSVTDAGETFSSIAACDLHLNLAGQSLSVYLGEGSGLYGLQRGYEDVVGSNPSIWVTSGGTGGSGLLSIDGGAKYWWDHLVNGPGPAALEWKASLDAAPAAQGDPDAIYWVFDQNLAYFLGTDAELSIANARTHYEALFEWMRDQVDPVARVPIIASVAGSFFNGTSEAQMTAARWLLLEIIAADANVFHGPEYFDLPRGVGDVHLGPQGQMLQGYRLAGVLDNVLDSGANGTGPMVNRIQELDSGRRYRIRVLGTDLTKGVTFPKFADGLAVLPAGTTPLNGTPVQIEYGYWDASDGNNYNIVLAAASVGATVVWPWGDRSRLAPGNYVRDAKPTGIGNYMPLRPIKSGAF